MQLYTQPKAGAAYADPILILLACLRFCFSLLPYCLVRQLALAAGVRSAATVGVGCASDNEVGHYLLGNK